MTGGQDDIGKLAGRRMPQVDVEEEVELLEAVPHERGVGHAHEVARAAHGSLERVRLAGGTGLRDGVGVGPHAPPVEQRVRVGAEALGAVGGAVAVGVVGRQAEVAHVVDVELGGAALAAGGVGVAGDGCENLDGTAVLHAVAVVLHAQLVHDAAVAPALVDAGGIDEGGLLDVGGGNARDALGNLRGVLVAALGELLPHGHGDVGGAVLEGHLELAVDGRVERLEVVERGHEALGELGAHGVGLGALEVPARPLVLGAVAVIALPGLLTLPDVALLVGDGVPVGVGPAAVGAGVEPLERLAGLVPHHVLVGAAVLLQVRLGEQGGLEGRGAVPDMGHLGAVGLLVFHHQEARVGPALHKLPVYQVVLDDDVAHGQSERGVGAALERQVDVRLLAQVGGTGVDRDERRGVEGLVNDGAARLVVVRALGAGRPDGEDLRAVHRCRPAEVPIGGKRRGEVTRALAHLVCAEAVGRVEPRPEGALVCVHAAGARHVEQGLGAVLGAHGLNAFIDCIDGLVPGDSHPAGVLALGVRALHGVTQAVGVIAGLQRGDRLVAAAAHGVAGALVALDFDGTAVLHRHPHAALHLAAPAADRAHPAGCVGAVEHLVVGLGQSRPRRHAEPRDDTGRCGNLQKAPAAYAFLHVVPPSPCLDISARTASLGPATNTLARRHVWAHRATLMNCRSSRRIS